MIQLSLNTPAERAAALRALTVYVNAMDALSAPASTPSILQSATALPPMHTGGIATPSVSDPLIIRSEATIPAADVPDVGAPLPPLPVAVSTPDLTAEQVFGVVPMPVLTAQQAAEALNGQHCRPAVPAVPAAAVELDSEGKPWDPELHASSKAKIGDGTWRKKRSAAPAVPTPPAALVVPTVPVAPVVPTPPVQAITAAEATKEMIGAMMAQKIDGPSINAICAAHGVPSFLALQQHPDKIAAVMAAFREKVPA